MSYGTSVRDTAFLATQSTLNQDWIARVLAAGGAFPSQTTLIANDVFFGAILSAGIYPKITICNLFPPDSLIAAITPLIRKGGSPSWTNHNFVAGDLTPNGMTGDGATKYLDTGFFPGSVTSSSSAHLAIGVPGDDFSTTQVEISIGDSATNDFRIFCHWTDQNAYSDVYGSNQLGFANGGVAIQQFVMASRTATNLAHYYQGRTATGWLDKTNIVTNEVNNASTTRSLILFANNTGGSITFFTKKRLSFASCGTGMTSAEGQALYNAFQAFRVNAAGGNGGV